MNWEQQEMFVCYCGVEAKETPPRSTFADDFGFFLAQIEKQKRTSVEFEGFFFTPDLLTCIRSVKVFF